MKKEIWIRYKTFCSHLIKRFASEKEFIEYYKEFVIPSLKDEPSKDLLKAEDVSDFVELFNKEFKDTYCICDYGHLFDLLRIKDEEMKDTLLMMDVIDCGQLD